MFDFFFFLSHSFTFSSFSFPFSSSLFLFLLPSLFPSLSPSRSFACRYFPLFTCDKEPRYRFANYQASSRYRLLDSYVSTAAHVVATTRGKKPVCTLCTRRKFTRRTAVVTTPCRCRARLLAENGFTLAARNDFRRVSSRGSFASVARVGSLVQTRSRFTPTHFRIHWRTCQVSSR